MGGAALVVPGAGDASAVSLEASLAHALRGGAPPGAAAALAVDLGTGQTVFAHNAGLAVVPASNEKLPISYAALVTLGPNYRFGTDVVGEGRQVGDVWEGRLVLRGFGDPSLTTAGLQRLVQKLAAQGIHKVTGDIVGDASWFDDRWTAPGWKASFAGAESPPLSGLVVNRAARKQRLVANPPLAAAALFDRLLRSAGIEARGAEVGRAPAAAPVLATVQSQRLSLILERMDEQSDNFTAEMILKELGAEAGAAGTTAAGAAVVRRDLGAAHVPLEGVRIADGSGLSSLDRVTAAELGRLLVVIWKNPVFRPLLVRSLPVAGESGTLAGRMTTGPGRGVVRAKTGTTDLSCALSGYVGSRYAFVVIQNGDPVNWTTARNAQDRFAETLALAARRR